jgi:hypothetical protein
MINNNVPIGLRITARLPFSEEGLIDSLSLRKFKDWNIEASANRKRAFA